MGQIIAAKAWANNEVAYVAWDIDGKIDDCLGFDVTRVYPLRRTVAFKSARMDRRIEYAAPCGWRSKGRAIRIGFPRIPVSGRFKS